MNHLCEYCNYETNHITNYKSHLKTLKHNKNKELYIISNNVKAELVKIHEKVDKVDNKVGNVNDKVDRVDIKVNKAIIKQNKFNRSVMTILTQDYANNPSLMKIDKYDFIKALELEYKSKLITKDCKLQQLIISDFKNKRLNDTIARLILKFVKKDDLKLQSVFNTDSTRFNYATKLEQAWLTDKLGLKLRDIILTPVIEYIIDSLQPLREEVEKQLLINKKKPNLERSDFIMNNSHFLMEVNYSLVKKRTHDQILFIISPQLHLESQNLENSLLN